MLRQLLKDGSRYIKIQFFNIYFSEGEYQKI